MKDLYEYGEGRSIWKPLAFPDARKITDVFSEASLNGGMPEIDNKPGADETQWRYIGGTSAFRGVSAAPHTSMGGRNYIVQDKQGGFFCFGRTASVFTSFWARPLPGIIPQVASTMISNAGSMELIVRNDMRVIVSCNDNNGIGKRYVALLDEGETLVSLLGDEDAEKLRAYDQNEANLKSCVTDKTIDLERAEMFGFEVRTR